MPEVIRPVENGNLPAAMKAFEALGDLVGGPHTVLVHCYGGALVEHASDVAMLLEGETVLKEFRVGAGRQSKCILLARTPGCGSRSGSRGLAGRVGRAGAGKPEVGRRADDAHQGGPFTRDLLPGGRVPTPLRIRSGCVPEVFFAPRPTTRCAACESGEEPNRSSICALRGKVS